jgi:hypothetical protein
MYFSEQRSSLMNCPVRGVNEICMGKGCAMWRWKPEINPDWKPKYDMMIIEDGHDYRTDPPPYIDSKTHGYCGLATRPNVHNN